MGKVSSFLGKLNINQKMKIGFGVIFAFILLNAIVTIVIHIVTQSKQSTETEEYLPVRADLLEMQNLITESKRLTASWVFIEKQDKTPDKIRLRTIVDTTFTKVFTNVKEMTKDWETSFTDTLNYLDTNIQEYFNLQRQVMDNLNSFDAYDDMMAQMESENLAGPDGDIAIMSVDLNQVMEYMINICDDKCTEIKDSIQTYTNIQLFVVVFMSLLVIAIAVFVAIILIQSIVKPLKDGVEFAQAIGNGNLNANISVHSNDEIGQLCDALRQMAINLRNIVFTINTNSSKLVVSGETLKANSMKLSKGASEQAASAEEVSTAIEEMVANIDQNTENAIATEKITSSTVENVNLSSQYSNEAAEAMGIISQKITIISDIAFQTNILALNAAVEAVRAGEHGKGFSVVAAEVRKLAERSKQAAKEIVDLVNKGMKVSQLAGEKAKALVPDIEKTTVLIKEISAASIEQKTGAEQINTAMQNLNVITQENASASDELTNSSLELSQLADNLKKVVGFFKLDGEQTYQEENNNTESESASESNETEEQSRSEVVREARQTHTTGTTIDLGKLSAKDLDDGNYESF